MVVRNIKWDTDGDKEVFDSLPQEVVLPDKVSDGNKKDCTYQQGIVPRNSG